MVQKSSLRPPLDVRGDDVLQFDGNFITNITQVVLIEYQSTLGESASPRKLQVTKSFP